MKLISNKKGAALLWVILTSIIITILLGAILSSTYAYFNYTMYTVKKQQAYFTARSAVSAVLEEFTSAEQVKDKTGSYVDADIPIMPEPNGKVEITDFGFDSKMGTAKADITRNEDDEVTVNVTATYAGEDYHMKATVVRQPLYFAGIAVKNLTLNGNLTLGAGSDFYWNNTSKFDPSSSDINKGGYKLTINGNFVSKGDATIPAGTTVAGHKFSKKVNFVADGRHSRKIWNPNEYIISNKTLEVDDEENIEYTSSAIGTLSRIFDTHPYYCNSNGQPHVFGRMSLNDRASILDQIIAAIGLGNFANDIADEQLKLTNSERDAMNIQYIEILSLSTTIDNLVADAKANSAFNPLAGFVWSTIDNLLSQFDAIQYDTLDVSYIDYSSTDERNRSDEVIPLTYMFVRGGTKKGLTVRVRYGSAPNKRSTINKITQYIQNGVSNLINRIFAIDQKPSYMVIYLEEKSTIELGYNGDNKRENSPEKLVFLYSIYGGEDTHVILNDGVTVLGEIICDDLQINGDVNMVYTSTSGSQIAKQKIAEYWAVSNYTDKEVVTDEAPQE